MHTAIWFSRHAPTAAQLAEIKAMGYTLAALETGQELGALSLDTDAARDAAALAILGLAAATGAIACFGVFPTPIQACLHRAAMDAVHTGAWPDASLVCYAAWNVQRCANGGKPTFAHHRFCCVGSLTHASLR